MSAPGFYHCSVKSVGRANGRSIVAAAAYRHGERLADERTGEVFDYQARGGVLERFILARDGTPAWAHDRARLWNEAERAEPRANGRLATEFELALPHELGDVARKQLLKEFLAPIIARHGVAADVAIHAPGKEGDHRNVHAHVLITHRELGADGFGDIANQHTMTRKRKGQEVQEKVAGIVATPADIKAIRKDWEQHINRAYERAGLDIRVDHRSHEDRGIAQEPTKHIGPAANEMEKRDPGSSDRAAVNRDIEERNAALRERAALEVAATKAQAELAAARRLEEFEQRFGGAASRTTEPRAPIHDRDAEEATWQKAIADAAEKAEREARAAATGRKDDIRGPASAAEQDRAAAEGRYEALRTHEAKTEPELRGTAAEIRLAWNLGRTASALEDTLAARGISLAAVSAEEARASQQRAAFAKEVGNFAPMWREGEIVAVDGYGSVHRLTERTTGQPQPEIEGRLVGIDRAALVNVTDAREAMQAAALEAWKAERRAEREQARPASWIENRIAECAEQAARLGATVLEDASGRRVDRVEALADRLRLDGERQTHIVTVHGREAFAAQLEEAGIAIVRVTETDAKALDALRADENLARLAAETNNQAYKGHHFAELLLGELAAVARNGDVHRINPDKFSDAKRFLDPAADAPGVVETRARFEIEGERQAEVWAQHRADIADWQLQRDNDRASARFDAVEIKGGVKAAEQEVEAAPMETAEAAREGLGVLAKLGQAFLGLFGGWAMAPPKLTPEQAKQEARAEEAERPQRDIARERAEWEARLAERLDEDARNRRRRREAGQEYDRDDDRGREREW